MVGQPMKWSRPYCPTCNAPLAPPFYCTRTVYCERATREPGWEPTAPDACV